MQTTSTGLTDALNVTRFLKTARKLYKM